MQGRSGRAPRHGERAIRHRLGRSVLLRPAWGHDGAAAQTAPHPSGRAGGL